MTMPTDNSTSKIEGLDGKQPIYCERLLPGPFAWLLIAFMTASLGIAYGYVYGQLFGMTLALFATFGIYLFMYFGSPLIVLDELVLRVGHARLPREFIGDPKLLDETKTRESQRLHTHRQAYLIMRAAIKDSIVIDVKDENDPHPYWQFSTRHPKQLMAVLAKV
jgi:hypothetical protein